MARTIQRGSSAAARFARGEITLAEKEQTEEVGNQARDRMIRSNLRLVVNISKPYSNRGMSLSDVIEEGNLGLLRAVEGFDPDMGARFSTYASWWIKQSIKRALINTVQPVHVPAYMIELIARWKQVHIELQDSNGRAPSIQEIALHMELPEKKVRIIKRAVRAYNAPTQSASNDSGGQMADMLPDEKALRPDDMVLDDDEAQRVADLLDKLDPREQTILQLRYGLGDTEPLTLKEIGAKIGLTRERVRQLEAEALEKLEKALTEG